MGATLVNDNMTNVVLEMDFSWSKTYRPDFLVTRSSQNLGSAGDALRAIFFKALKGGLQDDLSPTL